MATARYQSGSITLKKRAKGLDVWEWRWREDGGKQRSKLLGTTAQYPTEKDAHCAAVGTGEVPCVKIGKLWYFRSGQLNQWINSKTVVDSSASSVPTERTL